MEEGSQKVRESTQRVKDAITSLSKVRRDHIQTQASDRRRTALNMRRICGDGLLTQQGLAKSLMTFVGMEILGADEKTKEFSVQPCAKLGSDVDFSKPFSVALIADGPLSNLRLLPEAIGPRLQQRIDESIAALTNDGSSKISYCRFAPTPTDTVSEGKWVPSDFAKYSASPGHVTKFGTIWLYFSMIFWLRWLDNVKPLPGVGASHIGVAGEKVLVAWPMKDTVAAGSGLVDVMSMTENLSSKKAKDFMKNSVWATVKASPLFLSLRETTSSQICLLRLPPTP